MPKMMQVRGSRGPRTLFIAIPAYGGTIGAECVASLVPALEALKVAGFGVEVCIETGNCHVDDARISLVRRFLETDCTDLIFIDDDVGFCPDDIVGLVKPDRDVVAGVYPKKQDDEEFPVLCLPGERWADKDGLVEVEGAPTGFMRISRRCLEALCEAHKDRQFTGQTGGVYYPIFERCVIGGRRRSGDYAFCAKWRELGGKIFVNPEMRFTHTGMKTWEGRLADSWRKESGLPSPQLSDAIKRLKAGEGTHEVFCTIYDGWGNPCAALPDHLMTAYRLAKRAKGPVLETGSGITTLVMACAGADVHSLEHDWGWFQKIQRVLDQHELKATVHYAPMKDYDGFVWYTVPDALPKSFSMALCDGPNRDYGRSGFYRVLGERIKDAEWLVDDCDDGGQLAMLEHYGVGREIHVFGTDGMKKFAYARKRAVEVLSGAA
jgi:hypothetical protein